MKTYKNTDNHRKRRTNHYLFLTDDDDNQFIYRITDKNFTRDILKAPTKHFATVGMTVGCNRVEALADLKRLEVFHGEEVTMEEIEVGVN